MVIGIISVSLGTFAAFSGVQRKIEAEKTIIILLKDQLYREAATLSDLLITPISTALENYRSTADSTTAAFETTGAISYLLKNSNIRSALDQINQMNEYMTKRRTALFTSAAEFASLGEQLGLNPMSMAASDYSRLQYHTAKPLFVPFLQSSNDFAGNVRVMSQSCVTSISIIEEQLGQIEIESGKMSNSAIFSSVSIALALIASVFLLSLVVVNGISRRIQSLAKATQLFSDGDLGTTISLKGSDEVAELGDYLEKMRNALTGSIVKIQSASTLALKSKNELEDAVERSESETGVLSQSIEGINASADNLYSSVQISRTAVDGITSEVGKVSQMIESQAAMVEQSAASITEMAASINSLSRIMEKNKSGAEDLVKTASLGETQINGTAESIEHIQESAQTIIDMAEMIQGIAEQTNILAMNAAIEAAHAGESGKGFSVVADEIRHLAEAVSANSKSISESLKEILDSIAVANAEGKKTAESFQVIQKGITLVSGSFDEIMNGLIELGHGGDQIRDSMNDLASYTTDVNSNSASIKRQTSVVSGAISSVNETANSFIAAGKNAQGEVQKIRDILATVTEHATTIEYISSQLHDESSKYTVKFS